MRTARAPAHGLPNLSALTVTQSPSQSPSQSHSQSHSQSRTLGGRGSRRTCRSTGIDFLGASEHHLSRLLQRIAALEQGAGGQASSEQIDKLRSELETLRNMLKKEEQAKLAKKAYVDKRANDLRMAINKLKSEQFPREIYVLKDALKKKLNEKADRPSKEEMQEIAKRNSKVDDELETLIVAQAALEKTLAKKADSPSEEDIRKREEELETIEVSIKQLQEQLGLKAWSSDQLRLKDELLILKTREERNSAADSAATEERQKLKNELTELEEWADAVGKPDGPIAKLFEANENGSNERAENASAITALQTQLQKLQAQNERILQANNDVVAKELALARGQLQQRESELNELKSKMEVLTAKEDDLQGRVETIEHEFEHASKLIEALNSSVEEPDLRPYEAFESIGFAKMLQKFLRGVSEKINAGATADLQEIFSETSSTFERQLSAVRAELEARFATAVSEMKEEGIKVDEVFKAKVDKKLENFEIEVEGTRKAVANRNAKLEEQERTLDELKQLQSKFQQVYDKVFAQDGGGTRKLDAEVEIFLKKEKAGRLEEEQRNLEQERLARLDEEKRKQQALLDKESGEAWDESPSCLLDGTCPPQGDKGSMPVS